MNYPITQLNNLPIADDLYVLDADVTADIAEGFWDEQTQYNVDDDTTLSLTLAELLAMCDPKATGW